MQKLQLSQSLCKKKLCIKLFDRLPFKIMVLYAKAIPLCDTEEMCTKAKYVIN